MSRLRILFAIGSLEIGGAERQLTHYLKWLERSKFDLGLFLVSNRGPFLADIPDDVSVFAFEDRVIAPSVYFPGRTHRRLGRDLACALNEFDADLLVTRTFHLTLIAAQALQYRPTPHVAIDANDPRRDFPQVAGRFQFFKRRILKNAYRRANAVIGLSHGAAEGISTFYDLPGERVLVLPNFVDLEAIDRLANEPAPELSGDEFRIISVGRLVPEKGHRDLIEAVARLFHKSGLRNVRLVLIGDGPLRSELEDAAAVLGIAAQVTFVGFERNPYRYLRKGSLFCLPSYNEGMPGALLEAMACGIPVIASDCLSGPREILQGGDYGQLVPVGDVAALASAIERIYRNPDSAKLITVAARKRIEDEYSIPVGIARLADVLNKAAKGPI